MSEKRMVSNGSDSRSGSVVDGEGSSSRRERKAVDADASEVSHRVKGSGIESRSRGGGDGGGGGGGVEGEVWHHPAEEGSPNRGASESQKISNSSSTLANGWFRRRGGVKNVLFENAIR